MNGTANSCPSVPPEQGQACEAPPPCYHASCAYTVDVGCGAQQLDAFCDGAKFEVTPPNCP